MSSCSPLSFPLPLSLYRFHSLPPFLFLTQAECSLGPGKGLWRSVISWLHEHAKYTLGYQCSRYRWIEIKTIFEENWLALSQPWHGQVHGDLQETVKRDDVVVTTVSILWNCCVLNELACFWSRNMWYFLLEKSHFWIEIWQNYVVDTM